LVFKIVFSIHQSDLACLQSKSSNIESEHVTLSCQLKFCEEKLNETTKSLEKEKHQRKVETELLAKKLAELTKQVTLASVLKPQTGS
jgi:hypothetical protein